MCRCLSHLIRAEALEQQFLPVSQQKYYRNSLHETFKEVKMTFKEAKVIFQEDKMI